MLDRINHEQWLEWVWYYEKYGLPGFNQDGRIMDLLITLGNINRDPKKQRQPHEMVYFTSDRFKADDNGSTEDKLTQAVASIKGLSALK